jgi:hypothetical protein
MQKPKLAAGVFVLSCLLAVTLAKTQEPSTPSFEPATVVSSAEPVYPAMAIGSGTVVLAVRIDATGEIQHVKVIKGSGGGLNPPRSKRSRSGSSSLRCWKGNPSRPLSPWPSLSVGRSSAAGAVGSEVTFHRFSLS